MRKLLSRIENSLIRTKLGLGRVAREERGRVNVGLVVLMLLAALAVGAVVAAIISKDEILGEIRVQIPPGMPDY